MTERPELLDNRAAESGHGAALSYLFADIPATHAFATATGYVNLGGLHHLATLADGRPLRILLGAAPDPALGATLPALDRFEAQLDLLSGERDLARFPPSRAAEKLRAIEALLGRPEVEVRRYVARFLHGKAYLFGSADDARAALVTSANLTAAGLAHNLELGLVGYQPNVARQAFDWFDALWAQAAPFDDELRALLFPDPGLVDPRTVYLRALLELHDAEPDDPARATRPSALALASFQRDGYERARVIARRHGGVIYADGVGTGKTEIGLSFIEESNREEGHYALVVTPAQLARRWQERIDQARLSAQVVSFQALASDEQLVPASPSTHRHLNVAKDSYRLVIVDEAHALRNEDTTWYRAMERLLGGQRKQAVLLTATPINNGLWDLYNLVMLFGRHDRAFAAAGVDSVRALFLAAGANERDPENLDPDVLYPLADALSVRRDRVFIEREYDDASFPDGTPVRFPAPHLTTRRYDLDAAHPGLLDRIVAEIEALSMARYRPGAYELGGQETTAEAQLGGLIKSGVLKRFESCWRACLETVAAMLAAHEAFLLAWDEGTVLSRDALRAAARAEADESGLAAWVEAQLAEVGGTPVAAFDPAYRAAVEADRGRLEAICAALRPLGPAGDPKLALLADLIETSTARKIAVFTTYGATVRYLDEQLPERLAGRERITVIGGESTPDQRLAALARFAPRSVVRDDYVPPAGEVDLLLSTDVLSEGQNLQQAQAVISYDMPWNPQRVVQRNGRVIRLKSDHRDVHLTTMLPAAGELEALLGLEARVQGKIRAAGGVYGMESEVIEGVEAELRSYAARLADGDPALLDEPEEASGAFVGEELRRLIDRALEEGEVERVMRLPWGVGACFRQAPGGRSQGPPGLFFATRTPPMADAREGYRYWRYVELPGGELVSHDLQILRRIDPGGGVPSDDLAGVDLEAAWTLAAQDIVAAHNERADLRGAEEQVGPRQRWALELLRDPAVALPPGAGEVAKALEAARSASVRNALGAVQRAVDEGELTLDGAAERIVTVVRDLGLRPVEPPPLPERIGVEDLGVVCWMGVLPVG